MLFKLNLFYLFIFFTIETSFHVATQRLRRIQSLSWSHWRAGCDRYSSFVQLCWGMFTARRWRWRVKSWSLHVHDISVNARWSPSWQQGYLLFLEVFSLHKYCKCLARESAGVWSLCLFAAGPTGSPLCVYIHLYFMLLLSSAMYRQGFIVPCIPQMFGLLGYNHFFRVFMLPCVEN